MEEDIAPRLTKAGVALEFRKGLVECLPFVGVCPLQPNRIQLMLLVRGLADDTLEEVKP